MADEKLYGNCVFGIMSEGVSLFRVFFADKYAQ
jgi:hypothetical protein